MDAAQAILEVQVLCSNCAASVLLTLNPDKEGFLGYWIKTALFCVSVFLPGVVCVVYVSLLIF